MMMNIHSNFNQAMDMIIDSKLEKETEVLTNRIDQLEQKLLTATSNSHREILQQKEVFELLGIGRRRLKNWVERGLDEMRIDNRVYYRYSDIMQYIENGNK